MFVSTLLALILVAKLSIWDYAYVIAKKYANI